jgi:RNA polymerase sigma factor (sigma-70 family)
MTIGALWTRNRPVELGIARDYRIPGLDPDDIRQEALVALWEACRAYDNTKGKLPTFARTVIHRRLTDLLRAATTAKRTADFDHDAEPVGPDLETTVLQREQLSLLLDDPRVEKRRKWREAKQRQRAA